MQSAAVPARGAALAQLRLAFSEIRAAWLHAVAIKADALLEAAVEPMCYFLYTRSMMREAVEIFSVGVSKPSLER